MMNLEDETRADDIAELKLKAKNEFKAKNEYEAENEYKAERDIDSHRVVPEDVRAKLDMKFAVHRLFTLPMGMIKNYFKFSKELVSSGIYIADDYKHICCQFCEFKVDVTDVDNIKENPHNKCAGSSQKNDMPLQSESTMQFQMQYEAFRLCSLLKYPDWKVSPYELAKTGLFKSGMDSEDKCTCYYCQIEICEWTNTDTAVGEHTRFAKELNRPCRLLSGAADRERDNIPIGREIELSPKVQHDGIGSKHTGAEAFKPEDEQLSKEEMMQRLREFLMLLELVDVLNEMEENAHKPKTPLQAIFIELRKVNGLIRPRRLYGLRLVMNDGDSLVFTGFKKQK